VRGGNDKILGDVDWVLVGMYFVLVTFGISNVYSSVYNPEKPGLFNLDTEHGKQIMWVGIALFIGAIIMIIDGSLIRKLSFWTYGVLMLLLLLVLFTDPINGAKSWFGFGSFGIQPSEVAKVGVCLALSAYLKTRLQKLLLFLG
jgi:rod shape determining protein RodA